MQLFQGHPLFSEFHRQPVQKFRMIGSRCLSAEITICPNQAITKKGSPGTVDNDPVTYWVIRAYHPLGKLQSVGWFLAIL